MLTCAGHRRRKSSFYSSEPTEKGEKHGSLSESKIFHTNPRNSDSESIPRRQRQYIKSNEDQICQVPGERLTGHSLRITRVSSADKLARKLKASVSLDTSIASKEMCHSGSDADMKKYDSLEDVRCNDSDGEKPEGSNGHI